MGLKVRLHRSARADLKSILEYITRHASARSAERVRADVMRRIRFLSNSPLMGALTSDPLLRILQPTRYPYRIYYTVQSDEIVILHILHTARRTPEGLGA